MDLSSEIYHALLPAFITMVLGLPVTALGAIDGVVGERHPRGVLDRGDPGGNFVPARLARASRTQTTSGAAQEVAVLRRLPSARQGHQAAAPGGIPVHPRALLRSVSDPQGHRHR